MKVTSNGKEIGEVQLLDTNIPELLPIAIIVITDEDIRKQIFEHMKAGGEVLTLV